MLKSGYLLRLSQIEKCAQILAPETVDFPYFDFVLYFSSKLMISAVSGAKYQLELPKNPNLKDIKILKK